MSERGRDVTFQQEANLMPLGKRQQERPGELFHFSTKRSTPLLSIKSFSA
jgi:hypothetical protein